MSTASTFDIGDRFRVTGTFTNAAGTAADPTSVKFYYKTPAGVVASRSYATSTTVVKSATGVYYSDVVSTDDGYYAWRWSSTGSIIATVEGITYVRERMVST